MTKQVALRAFTQADQAALGRWAIDASYGDLSARHRHDLGRVLPSSPCQPWRATG